MTSTNDERIIAVLQVLDDGELTKTELRDRVGGNRNAATALINELIDDGFLTTRSEPQVFGRPLTVVNLSDNARALIRKSERVRNEDFRKSSWRGSAFTMKDARASDPLDEFEDTSMILGLANFVLINVPQHEWFTLTSILDRAPVSWDELNKRVVADACRSAWLEHGVIDCTFDHQENWLVTASESMRAYMHEYVNGSRSYIAKAKSEHSRWSW